jgi:hyperosmotically inducible protein
MHRAQLSSRQRRTVDVAMFAGTSDQGGQTMKSRLLIAAGAAVLAVACGQSDAGITTSVKNRLTSDDLVRARNIDVDTADRVVTLSGEVESSAEEAQALQLARNTEGVANVVDRIEVVPEADVAAPTPDNAVSDAGTTAEIKAKLLADTQVSGLRIDVDTKDSVVTLTGAVATMAEKNKALELARSVSGVARVEDRLTIEPR